MLVKYIFGIKCFTFFNIYYKIFILKVHILFEKELIMEKEIVQIIATQLGKKVEDIKLESKLIQDLGADSLDIVELLMKLEDEYGITIPDQDAANLVTIGDVVKFMESQNIK